MTLILKKVWVLFVIAVIFAPCFVEAFDLVGREMLQKSLDCISMFRELLGQESCEFKKVFMVTVVGNPFFGWFKNGNQFFACSDKIVLSLNTAVGSDAPVFKDNGTHNSQKTSRGNNDSSYDWCFHYAMYILFFILVLILVNFILWDNDSKHNKDGLSSKQFRSFLLCAPKFLKVFSS